MRGFWEKAGAALVLLMAAGIVAHGQWFTKLRLGPVYFVELIFIAVLACILLSRSWRALGPFRLTTASPVLWAAPFFAWGLALLAVDLLFRREQIVSFQRVLQHAIVFVYPLLWIPVGAWLARRLPRAAAGLVAMVVGVSTLWFLFDIDVKNLSMGPTPAVLLLVALYKLINESSTIKNKAPYSFAVVFFAAAAFLSIWRPFWSGYMVQRTTLVILLIVILAVPLYLSRSRPLRAVLPALCATFLLFSGILAGIAMRSGGESLDEVAKSRVYESLQHGEDLNFDSETGKPIRSGKLFAFRDRTFWWKRAIEQWQASPILGIGFIPEIPDYLRPGVKNDGIFEGGLDFMGRGEMKGKPVSGPHNSYLTVLARTGLVGFFLFALIWLGWAMSVRKLIANGVDRGREAFVALLVFVPFCGAAYALFHTGFETPRSNVILWLLVGMLMAWAQEPRNKKMTFGLGLR